MANLQASATYSKNRWEYPGGVKGTLSLADDKVSFTSQDNQALALEIPLNQISKVVVGTPTIIKTNTGNRYLFSMVGVNPILMTRAGGGVVQAVAEQKAHLDQWLQAFKQTGLPTHDHTAKRVGKLFALSTLIFLVIVILLLAILH